MPVVTLTSRRNLPGGAANTAVNAHGLGGRVHFLSVVGDDGPGHILRQALEERGLSTASLLNSPRRRTLVKQRVMAASQLLLRLDDGSTEDIDSQLEDALIARLVRLFPECDAVICSDYHYGILTPRVLQALAELQARRPRVLVVDSRRLEAFSGLGVSAVKPNYEEALALLGQRPPSAPHCRATAIAPFGERILELTGARLAAVTLDREGALMFERGRPPYRTYASACRQACVAGAGDTFASALALALSAGAEGSAAAELASAATAVVVAKEHTAICFAQELREQVAAGGKYVAQLDRLAARAESYRQQGRRIVFTNGCFDILHRGHVTYLHRARALGDVLIVGVNTDDSIRRLKGPQRPINTLEDRLGVLAALDCVDHLIAFDENTPCNLIRALRPDVFVKGGDYARKRLPEAPLVEQLGGVVHILPLVQDRSTTGIIERIRETCVTNGAVPLQNV